MQPYTQRVVEIIKSIPEGQVMTYGQIAELAGSRRGARQVVRILHSLSAAYGLPWHRVVNAKGEIVIKDEESRYVQQLYLQREGVTFAGNGRVDLESCRYIPDRS
ncbi:MGMT family protein [Paenibacillus alkalitolerans]|uniref:MGMT family protein n=1 Tax=Paenibacillus alkalitolerans TaxID=2799335 RepID=UPI0018F4B15B|nr:MGMT family protein [Paenibacillus alkalitolerans]